MYVLVDSALHGPVVSILLPSDHPISLEIHDLAVERATDDLHHRQDAAPLFGIQKVASDALGEACHGWGASKADDGPFEAIGWCTVESQEALDAALAEHGAAIGADVANYTNVAPQMVIGTVAR